MGAATVAVGMGGVVAVTAADAGGMAAAVLAAVTAEAEEVAAVTAEAEEVAEEGRAVAVGAMVVAKAAGAGRHCRRRRGPGSSCSARRWCRGPYTWSGYYVCPCGRSYCIRGPGPASSSSP